MFETGAGGSAPKHVQQFVEENHLRWDSLGEFLALAVSLEHLSETSGNRRAKVLADTLDKATEKLLETRKSPSPKVRELDNRGSHFYLALYWAEAMAAQNDDPELRSRFAPLAKKLAENATKIVGELNAVQGHPVDLGGYYVPDPKLASAAIRPSTTFNTILESF
jgi:isocitrate dehydrogenase